jgi:hypothetical protein
MKLITIITSYTVDSDITHAMDEELSYQNVEAFADIEAPILESLSKHQFEVDY